MKAISGENQKKMENSLHSLFLFELANLLSAEHQLRKAFPKIIKTAQSKELREAIKNNLADTEGHIDRLEAIFRSVGEKPKRRPSVTMKSLIKEGRQIIREQKKKLSLDAAIVAVAQKIEYYQIASYMTACAWAEHMDHEEAFLHLNKTLEEEKRADKKLTSLASLLLNDVAPI